MISDHAVKNLLWIIEPAISPHLPSEVQLELAVVKETKRYADFVSFLGPFEDTSPMLLLKSWALVGQVMEGIFIDDVYLDMLTARSLFNEAFKRSDIYAFLPKEKRSRYRAKFNPELARVKRFAIKNDLPTEPNTHVEQIVREDDNPRPSSRKSLIARLFGI